MTTSTTTSSFTLTDPITGKVITHNGFNVPLTRISQFCQAGVHGDVCPISHQSLSEMKVEFQTIKKITCLCRCHWQKDFQK
jgi:hypothetical protein